MICTPLYVQLKESIVRDVADGRLAPGSRLPSTLQLASKYGVCHKTVQIAMRALVREGRSSDVPGMAPLWPMSAKRTWWRCPGRDVLHC